MNVRSAYAVVNYYVTVFWNLCFELKFVIRVVILVRDNLSLYEVETYYLSHPPRAM